MSYDNDNNRAPDFAAADAAQWPMHDKRCLVCGTGCGPFGAIVCEHCEAQLIAIFGRGQDGDLSERAFGWIFEAIDDADACADRKEAS